jgi:hypothetical protein
MTTQLPQLCARRACLFVTTRERPAPALLELLAATLQRLQVQAEHQHLVTLADEPEQGRQHHVRIAPCLVLDTGARLIQLPGDPALLEASDLEHALTR